MAEFIIRPLERTDREWVAHFLDQHWGSTQLVSRGQAVYGHLLPGYIAETVPATGAAEADDDSDNASTGDAAQEEAQPIGLLTYQLTSNACEILTLNSLRPGIGVGSALVETAINAMREVKDIERVWLITTNDNLPALKFWQKRDFELVAVHRNAIHQARRIKPQIPIVGLEGIPIRDEIELEFRL